MAFISLLIISFHSILNLCNVFSIKPLISDLYLKQSLMPLTTPGTPEFFNLVLNLYKDVKLFLGVELIFILISSAASSFFAIATTYTAAATHSGKKLSIKALTSITVSIILLLLVLLVITSKALAITLAVLFLIFYAYLAVVWDLSFVVSVFEEKSEIEALGKAANIVKGMQLQGFVLNLGIMVLSLVLSLSWKLMTKQTAEMQVIVGIVALNSICLVLNMFEYMALTDMYYQCKRNHGEVVELKGTVEYNEVSSSPLIAV
ncbi:hypothetical protein SLEP1_g57180 [Rubroshorea leprosula]|uniref:Uncharacterized protein n=1 Tax=Rubroshorea leprosula TaxID=152421 RepID=A0AAV5MLS0_9ROSI|nr:hypothetical protein SLEP1_g57180 [Rubroshorea leprosula]